MTHELAVSPEKAAELRRQWAASASAAVVDASPYHVLATDAAEMGNAQAKMVAWAKARMDKLTVDLDVERTSLDLAVTNGWLTVPFARRIRTMERQLDFFGKMLDALNAGYVIVPNFEMDVFAIRTKRSAPQGWWSKGRDVEVRQGAETLPVGDGAYRNPVPATIDRVDVETNAQGKTEHVWYSRPSEFEEIEFPIALARPELMSATSVAMAGKIFDEIGVAHDSWRPINRGRTNRRSDPIILGRIINPRRNGAALTFFLGWYFDPSAL